MSVLNIIDDKSIYLTYIRTILEENIDPLKINKDSLVILQVFCDGKLTRKGIMNPLGEENFDVSIVFYKFRNITKNKNVLGVRIFISNSVITLFKITTPDLDSTQREIEDEVEQALRDIFS